jgi:hypothetical protein
MTNLVEETIGNWVSDFCQSDSLKLFPGTVADAAQAILETLLRSAHQSRGAALESFEESDLQHALIGGVARLQIDEAAKPFVPSLCRAFLEDLQKRGRIGNGLTLGRYVGALKQSYLEASSGKGVSYQRPGEKIGRNDPCPCGSGKKYKKCCGSATS